MYNRQLETFIKVADAGSFSKAAEQLYISPTAVIKQINLLENELDLTLFIRTHRGIRLTESGVSLYQDAKYIIQYAQDSLVRARLRMQPEEKVVRIGTSLITPSEFLLDLWPQIQPFCPDIKLQLIPYENTQENAREILKNLGQNIDLVAGLFDQRMLKFRGCDALELNKAPFCCAVSIHHPLAAKKKLTMQDLLGERVLLVERGKFEYFDLLRDDIWKNYPQISIIDFPFINISIFNQCENSNDVLISVDYWAHVHPLIKLLPVEWEYAVPYGLLHAPEPSEHVKQFLGAVKKVLHLK